MKYIESIIFVFAIIKIINTIIYYKRKGGYKNTFSLIILLGLSVLLYLYTLINC